MGWRLFSFGIALAACIHAYLNPESSFFPKTATEAQFKLRDFWHRTWFMHQASPYVLSEQSHVVQHPPHKDALTPAQRKALEDSEGLPIGEDDTTVSIQPISKMPAYFISHGSPSTMFEPETLPYKSLQALGKEIISHKPKAIVVVSSHWTGDELVLYVNNAEQNPLIYDFSGFPKEYYEQTFESKADPMLADRLIKMYRENKVAALPKARGLDHGVWVPFKIMFNDTLDIPIVQVSLLDTGSPARSLKVGKAIAALRDEGVMFIGTGMAVHNLRVMHRYSADNPPPWVESWLEAQRKMVEEYSGDRREIRAKQMTFNSNYRNAHPTSEHLTPLHFVIGAAGEDEGETLFSMIDGSLAWAHYRFSAPEQVM